MRPTSHAITELSPADDKLIAELVRKAIGDRGALTHRRGRAAVLYRGHDTWRRSSATAASAPGALHFPAVGPVGIEPSTRGLKARNCRSSEQAVCVPFRARPADLALANDDE
jgi:hypothetical protein